MLKDIVLCDSAEYSVGDTVYFVLDDKTIMPGIVDYISSLHRDYYYNIVLYKNGKYIETLINRDAKHTNPSRQILIETTIEIERRF
jgi:hypothetical protein